MAKKFSTDEVKAITGASGGIPVDVPFYYVPPFSDIVMLGINMKENPDQKIVDAIKRRLVATGGYCPCSPIRDEDHLCICKKMREHGDCCCGLYVKD
jgi:hypothetical protein